MKLPKYHGPFDVGAVDVEVPVRDPCDFIPDYLNRFLLNKLAKNGHKVSNRKTERVSRVFQSEFGEELKEGVNNGLLETEFMSEHGYMMRHATLHLRTVLFTLWYPASCKLPAKKKKKYPHVKWLGWYVCGWHN